MVYKNMLLTEEIFFINLYGNNRQIEVLKSLLNNNRIDMIIKLYNYIKGGL